MTATRPHDAELERIRTLFLQMCVRAESMVQQAVRSVLHRDPHMARAVVAADEAIDDLERELDRLAAGYLAQQRVLTRQPSPQQPPRRKRDRQAQPDGHIVVHGPRQHLPHRGVLGIQPPGRSLWAVAIRRM